MYLLRAAVWSGNPREVKYFNCIAENFDPNKTLREYMAANTIFTVDFECMMKAAGMEGPYKFREVHWHNAATGEFVVVGEDEFQITSVKSMQLTVDRTKDGLTIRDYKPAPHECVYANNDRCDVCFEEKVSP